MSCVLRAGGIEFDMEAFGENSPFKPCAFFWRGELRSEARPESGCHEASRFHLVVSAADFADFAQQKLDAVAFLTANEAELRRLVAFPGVEYVKLDFGVNRHDVFVESYDLPPDLLLLAGGLGIGIEISCYPEPKEKTEPT